MNFKLSIKLFFITIFISQNLLLAQFEGGLRGGTLFPSSIGNQYPSINPANFWTSRRSNFSILLPLSIQLNNNSVSPNWLNSFLFSGKHLDKQSVDNMLNEIPANGLSLNGHGHFMLFGLSYKKLAMYVGGSVDLYGTIPKSIFQTGFQGIEFDSSIDLNDTQFGMQSVLPVSFVLSREIGNNLYIGFGLKGLFGLAYLSINGSGGITSHEDKLLGNGKIQIQYNLGDMHVKVDSLLAYSSEGKFSPNINGRGYAIDIGMTKFIGNNWTLSLSVQNLMGQLSWDKNSSHNHVIQFEMDFNSDEFEEMGEYTQAQQDSLMETIITKDLTTTIDNLTSTLPLKIDIESEYLFGKNLLLFNSASYEAESDVIPESQIEISGGLRLLPHRRIPLTLGITYNSLWGLKWGGGFGAHFNNYHLDILFSQNGGFVNEAKGFSVSLFNYFYF
jgi:hypothetical protein